MASVAPRVRGYLSLCAYQRSQSVSSRRDTEYASGRLQDKGGFPILGTRLWEAELQLVATVRHLSSVLSRRFYFTISHWA